MRNDSLAGLPSLHLLAGYGAAIVVFGRVLRWFKKKDGKFFAYYLMHDYAYSAASNGAIPDELEARMAAFGDQIAGHRGQAGHAAPGPLPGCPHLNAAHAQTS